jgi:hypothetical protein
MSKEILTSYSEHYFNISKEHFLEFLKLDEKYKDTISKYDITKKRWESELDEKDSVEMEFLLETAAGFRNERSAAGHITIIFAALCLEAIINHYGMSRSSKAYFDDYLDNFNLKTKWLFFPKLLSNCEFERSSNEYGLFKKLIELRNNLVHYKPKAINFSFFLENLNGNIDEQFFTQVKDSVKAMVYMIKKLKKQILAGTNINGMKYFKMKTRIF